MGELIIPIRPADDDDRAGILELAPRLAEDVARDHGLRSLTLHTGAFNANANACYAALGFAEEEVRLTRPIRPEVESER